MPSVCLSLYLSPHTVAVADAMRVAWSTGLPVNVTTMAEAVGSDVTNVVRSCVTEGRFGPAAHILSSYLSQDHCLAVSEYTRELIVESAAEIDALHGTSFAAQCRARVGISYPAIDTAPYLDLDEHEIDRVLAERGLERGGYVLFLSRLAHAKGVDDLIEGFVRSGARNGHRLVIVGRGPQADELRAQAAASDAAELIDFLDDVGDAEKPYLMAGCAAFVLPSKPRPEFVETFGIAIAEQLLAGGGPVITTETGGIGEAAGGHAIIIPVDDPDAIARSIDDAVALPLDEVRRRAERGRAHALQFDRANVFDRLFARVFPERVRVHAGD